MNYFKNCYRSRKAMILIKPIIRQANWYSTKRLKIQLKFKRIKDRIKTGLSTQNKFNGKSIKKKKKIKNCKNKKRKKRILQTF